MNHRHSPKEVSESRDHPQLHRAFHILCAALALLVIGCGRRAGMSPSIRGMSFTAQPIGHSSSEPPWITHLTIADLDKKGRPVIIVCDARANQVSCIRRLPTGEYVETPLGQPIAGPVHAAVVDIDGDDDLDILVASMGIVIPSDARTGAVVLLENDGAGHFTNRVLLDKTYRVTDVEVADLDGDGDLDLVVGQFGYFEGQVQWRENQGDGKYASHVLLDLAGTIHTPIADLDGDKKPDIAALVSQDWEEVHAFFNQGQGKFAVRILYGSTNKDYGSSGLTVADLDRDGDMDIIYTNGDGFDYSTPGARPWHGVQWLENDGHGKFTFHRVGSLPGAYSPLVIDLDGDGDLDIVATSGFNDWNKPDAVALAWFENDGGMKFARRDLAREPTHQITVTGADLDGDGDVELVSGGFCFYPPFDRSARVTLWKRRR